MKNKFIKNKVNYKSVNERGNIMGNKVFGEYYLGLDMGTNSVGWAVTDEKYQLLKVKGKICGGFGNLMRRRQQLTVGHTALPEEEDKERWQGSVC